MTDTVETLRADIDNLRKDFQDYAKQNDLRLGHATKDFPIGEIIEDAEVIAIEQDRLNPPIKLQAVEQI